MSNQIQNLVFSGGGVKALAYAGVLKALEEKGIQSQIKAVAGASGGAMMAAFFAVGYRADEIKKIMDITDFTKFKDGSWSILGSFYRFYKYFGIYEGDYAEEWVENLLEKKSQIKGITFLQVFEKFGTELVVTGTSLSKKLTYYYNYLTHPHLKVSSAVRISMGYPIFFKTINKEGETLVDGGVLDNYPIDYFFRPDQRGLISTEYQTIGFLLMGGGLRPTPRIYYGDAHITNIMEYCEDLVDTLLLQIERQHIKDDYWKLTVPIDTEKISTLDFSLTSKQKTMLYNNGYLATLQFLNKIDSSGLSLLDEIP